MNLNKSQFNSLYQKYGVIFIFIAEIIIFSFLSEDFLRPNNLLMVGRQVSFIGIAAVGGTFLMITGGIDISVGSMLAFSGVLVSLLTVNCGLPFIFSIIITLICGAFFGFINGIAYTRFRISPLIATLAMQTILKGLAFLLTNAEPIYGLPDKFLFLGQGYIFGVIPVPFIVLLLTFLFGFWVLNYTYFGRYLYAIGGNDEAARLSGINIEKVSLIAFASSGMFAALVGVLMAARLTSGQPSIGTDFPMDVITAIVLGGVSINGGSGNIGGVLFGVFIMGVLSNGMIMIGLGEYWQWVIKGLVLFLAVAMSNVNLNKD